MASNVRGPAIFLAQFAGDATPFNSFDAICGWAAGLGYKGVQIPSWDARLFDLAKAADSKAYCEELAGIANRHGITITELSTHLQGQLVAVHPAYDEAFDAFAPAAVHGRPRERQKWAVDQLMLAAKASANLGLHAHVTFSGALAWPFLYPWPPRAAGLIDTAFDELARRWRPILNAFDEADCFVCFEIHP
ncbi:MAG: TIM barrel protein, partial [Methylobacteriaceae bacterium]|nr:TIM barrel protein [Methylobacteriaceae bacterium]